MAGRLTIDLITGKVFLFEPQITSGTGGTGGGGSGSTYLEVNTFNELPAASSNNGNIYVVRNSVGNYVLNRKEAGLYYSNGTVWRRLGNIPSFLNADNFAIYGENGGSEVGGINFDISQITGGSQTIQTLTVRDTGGTIALLADLNAKVDTSAFADYTGNTVPSTYVSISGFNSYTGSTLSLINTKQDQLIAGDGIQISGNTISINVPNSIQLKDISGGTEINTVPQTPINWTTLEYSGTSLSFTGISRIYIQEDSDYVVSYNLNYRLQSGNRKIIGSAVRLNGTTLVTPTSSSSYVRNTSNNTGANSMPDYKLSLNNGDYVELVAFRIGDSGSVLTVADGSWIKLKKII